MPSYELILPIKLNLPLEALPAAVLTACEALSCLKAFSTASEALPAFSETSIHSNGHHPLRLCAPVIK